MLAEANIVDPVGTAAANRSSSHQDWLSINFRPNGNADQFLKNGWSFQENDGIWGVGLDSSLTLPPAPGLGSHQLEIIASSLAGSLGVGPHRLVIIMNGTEIFSTSFRQRAPGPVRCMIPSALLHMERENELVLRHPDAVAPASLLSGKGDQRQLGICMVTLRIASMGEHSSAAAPATPPSRNRDARSQRKLVLCRWSPASFHIGCLLEPFPPFDDTFEIRYVRGDTPWDVPLAALSDDDRDRLTVILEEVVEVCQPRTAPIKPDNVVHLRYPKLSINCLWPLQGNDPRLKLEPPFYPQGRYPVTDVAALQLAGKNITDKKLLEQYNRLSRRLMPDLQLCLSQDIERWHALDVCCEVKLSKFLLANFQSISLFHGPNVPASSLICYVVEHLLGALLKYFAVSPADLYRAFSTYVQGYQGPFFDQAPVHPLVVEGLGISYLPSDYRYRRGHTKRTFHEHTIDYIRWAPWFANRRGEHEAQTVTSRETDAAAVGRAGRSVVTEKPILLIYSNCQADHIAKMLWQNQSLTDQIEVKYLFIHSLEEPGKGWDTYPDDYMDRVTCVWEQVSDAFPEQRAELNRRLPAGVRRIRFPALTAKVLWPFSTTDPRPSRRRLYLYGDSVAVRVAKKLNVSNAADEDIYAAFMELSAKQMPDLDRFLELESWAWQSRDRGCDISVADYVVDNIKKTQLFYESGRPTASPVQHIALKLLRETLDKSYSDHGSIIDAAQQMFKNYIGYDTFAQPIHPIVAERLQLQWFDPDATYRWFMHDWTFKEWIVRCVRLAPYVDTLF